MATKKPEATTASPATDATNAAPKAKRENLFSSAIGSDFKRREAKLRLGFNIVGNRVKKLGLSQEDQDKVIAILKAGYEAQAQKIFSAPASQEPLV